MASSPTDTNRRSPSADVSSQVSAIGSNSTVSASLNRTPCFAALVAAFRGSHVTRIYVLYAYCWWPGKPTRIGRSNDQPHPPALPKAPAPVGCRRCWMRVLADWLGRHPGPVGPGIPAGSLTRAGLRQPAGGLTRQERRQRRSAEPHEPSVTGGLDQNGPYGRTDWIILQARGSLHIGHLATKRRLQVISL
jgi:hypothetical protein